ncbi:tyrosine-protein phosphatase [Amphritea pacifica]|uniref:protein-tyrosine-phosphatase n=1 Tax=Amphritea pacifica TaxID=2811233 RepID=A0ABS2W7Q2_9GAMM|nr:CpsB/CapC family capsule biosynthesis tyrosine phosphatase [Amphritea pacifica]MBN0987745.1 capsular biosynthesis protein [Amphritea pacifica]MBN1007669.1 capsular biosynthesis protein [Amphritea pacifica]
MYDLHNHILPGIDDGPATLEESLELAQIAVADGIRHIVVTPHIHPGRYENQIATITPVLETLRQAITTAGLPLTLSMGAELRISAEMISMIPSGKIPFLGHWQGKKVLLLELPHSHIPPGTDKLITWLKAQNIQPMIAHPERNKEVAGNVDKINPFVEQGCLLQVTAMSVAGRFGDAARNTAEILLQRDWVTLLASDAHNSKHRPPVLSEGMQAAAEIIGEQAARALVSSIPEYIISGNDHT